MPDSKKNQRHYPQPSGQKKGCGFPVMRIVVIFSLATGFLLSLRKGKLKVDERRLWRQMWKNYKQGDVVLADRAFCSFANYWMLSKKKVDSVMRLHQGRKEKEIIKKFNKNDYLAQWAKGKKWSAPHWLTEKQWELMPKTMTVRYVKVFVDIPGYRTKQLTVATTLLDNRKYPSHAIAELYRRRWMAEIFLRDIKTTMNMDVLRCKTPEMIHKELTIFIIAYNLIRSLIWQAALKKGLDPYSISFKGAITTIRQWTSLMGNIEEDEERKGFIEALMEVIGTDTIPIRKKNRREPRAIKRRLNCTYQLLTKPRKKFKEIPHRHSYKKDKRRRI